ncbi:ribosome-binding ATPase YchF [Candidatus Nitromaritima sp. SCGC AAA799-C22]|nr:ribosome-binding ATPase YchF [Candidatus Nitromaritima sp. SCGC AAA799-C22]
MGFSCGLVGLPNVGKTTLFNALTGAHAEATNYAFTSAQPNTGIVNVPDPRLDKISELVEAKKTVYTTLEFVDLAGLAKGASRGEGLGNQFLGRIREVDAIAHIVRCFDDPNIPHVSDTIDPPSDIDAIDTELIIADLETLERRKAKLEKTAKSGDKDAKIQLELIARITEILDDNRPARRVEIRNDVEKKLIKEYNLLTSIPVLYVCNIQDPSESGNDYVRAVKEHAKAEEIPVVVLAGKLESEIRDIEDPEERKAFMDEMGLDEPGLNQMIRTGYGLLGLVTFFTVGGAENRAWTVRKNTRAPQAAGAIHSDFEKGFIRAVVYSFDELVKYKNENAVKEAGKLRLEGKDYIFQDGDIAHFRFNV